MTEQYTTTISSAKAYAQNLNTIKSNLPNQLHFLNAPFYGQWQELSGKKVIYFDIKKSGELIGCGMAIRYALPGRFWYYYCPYGPIVTEWTTDLSASIKKFFNTQPDNKLLFSRLDADNRLDFKVPPNYVAATASLQPRNEWVLDITPELSQIHDNFHKTARYHIRLAQRNNTAVSFHKTTPDQLDVFYKLMLATSNRNNFGLLPKAYYRAVFKTLESTNNGFLGLTTVGDQIVAGAVIVIYDHQAHYVFGCSDDQFRRIAPSYYLQFSCIQEARNRGCTLYNFGGISDEIKGTRLQGVSVFKKRFGGRAVSHGMPTDIIKSPTLYRLFGIYKLGQHLRNQWSRPS